MPKTHDFLSRRMYAPGELERLQAAFDAQVRWLSALVRPAVARSAPADLAELAPLSVADAAALKALGWELAPFDLPSFIEAESTLLSTHVLRLWHARSHARPDESLPARTAHAQQGALAHLGWPLEGELALTLDAALAQGVPRALQ